MALTVEARADFVRHAATLSLWLAARRAAEGACFRRVLSAHTPLYRLTALWDGTGHPADGHADPQWEALLDRLEALAEHPHALEPKGLETL